jgi:hypothetical protein
LKNHDPFPAVTKAYQAAKIAMQKSGDVDYALRNLALVVLELRLQMQTEKKK